MTARRTSTDVPFSARQMYELVADVEQYPDFIPWCVALRVVRRDLRNDAGTLLADMVVAYRVFRERFRSKVTLDPAQFAVDAHYTEGPFQTLRTEWRFTEKRDGGSTIDFFIEFQFRSLLLQSTARMVFEQAFARMTDAFVARAYELYGDRAIAEAAQQKL
jgi:coenzyme Q-binding protein COQ10